MSDQVKLRQTITLTLDVMVSDESEDYLEVEITHPRLSGAMYLTVNDRKEAEEVMTRLDLSEQDDEENLSKLKTFFSPSSPPSVISLPASSSYSSSRPSTTTVSPSTEVRQIGPTRVSTAPVDSLVRNSVSLAGGLLDFAAGIKKLRKK